MEYSGQDFVAQILRIVAGFVLGLLIVGAFLAFGFFTTINPAQDPIGTVFIATFSFFAASAVGGVVFLPLFFAVVIAEIFRLRSVIYHIGVPGLVIAVIWVLGESPQGAASQSDIRDGSLIALAGGFLGGAVYWTLAGRYSGCWRRSET
ncbi:MAG: translation initiation factor IF-3 [Rhodobacteraceae bacterium]|nr:translation initiation factor IF-3 [Paracoccaceae bacterium]